MDSIVEAMKTLDALTARLDDASKGAREVQERLERAEQKVRELSMELITVRGESGENWAMAQAYERHIKQLALAWKDENSEDYSAFSDGYECARKDSAHTLIQLVDDMRGERGLPPEKW